MAVVSEAVQAGQSVLDFVGQIHDRFTASGHYKSKAAVLQAKLDSLKQDDSIQLLPDSGTTRQTLRKAESALKTAQARLNSWEERVDSSQSCLQCIWWLCAKLVFAFCPLENALKELDEDLESIPKLVDVENKSAETRRKADISTRVHDNNKYVPIEESQREVIIAIEDTEGPPLILLHGGVGKGKSTLARYMCKRYGKSGEMSNVFDHVIVVSCGNSSISDSATKQYEILDKHSVTSLTEDTNTKFEKSKSRKSSDAKSRIEEALQKYFLHKKILMVLDDVSDPGFLSKMWMAARDGKDDKILITSQKSNLCDAFPRDFVAIRMKNPTGEEARRILASLVGLENNTIPRHLLGIANKMIKATDGNPLALSCLASAFSYGQDRKGKSEWQDAWNELSSQLGNTETSFVLAQNDGIAPPRSLWSAMKLCIDSLETRFANQILLLMYACEGGAVPEGVLRIVCAGLHMSSTAFNKSRDELVMRELLKRLADTLTSKTNLGKELNEKELQESPTWSLQSLVKLYMKWNVAGKQQMAAMISAWLASDAQFSQGSIINSNGDCGTEIVEIDIEQVEIVKVMESDDETRVRIVLCALYFDHNHTDQGATRAVIEACKRSNIDSEDTRNKLRRKAIEPLSRLLDKREEQFGVESDEKLGEGVGEDSDEELGEQWSKEDKCCVRKVLLEYMCKRQLDAENISCLLKVAACPSPQLATLKALTHILSIEETPLLNENTITFLPVVLDFFKLKEGFHNSVQEAASETLFAICWKAAYDKSALLVANRHGVLDVLKQLLDCKSAVLAENAAQALKGLAFTYQVPVRQTITTQPGILASLLNCLYDQSKPRLQITAAGAFANFTAEAENDSLRLRIASEEGALVGLVHCLSKQDNDALQETAALALGNLAAAEDDSLRLRIASEEGALVGLVHCLSKHDNDALRETAARALGNLVASKDNSLKLKISSEEGALAGLVNCLSKHDNDALQQQASGALANLAAAEDDSLRLRIASEEGALVGLVNCLSKHDNDALLERAAHALAGLAAAEDDSLMLRIATEEGALLGLVHCLSKQDNDALRKQASRALANLAAAKDHSLRLRIASEEGALVGLVNCWSQSEDRGVQAYAALAVALLSYSPDARLILRGTEGLVEGLTSLVGDDVDAATRHLAVTTLFNLDPTLAQEMGLLSAKLDVPTLSCRIFVKAKLGDFEGALDDANEAVGRNDTGTDGSKAFIFQERGVLKRMMGDWEGALADLDEGLKLEANDYDRLKHRGYVKFLLDDVEGARADAEWALSRESSRDDSDLYLGGSAVEYLGYKL